ncbi:hypothetical protein PIB30_067107 [Stylosanthes scabra]|uniref:Uncharacterized protein n=1 Tax=Stylosanthes scabra TaxID=79078 RepID=A0ABU6QLY2_9FABA|nr:hypothetical protein [Stylosanthes scabra]
MGGQHSTFGVRRCAFGDKPYGVAESYSREGIDMEVVLSTSGYSMYAQRVPSSYVPAATYFFKVQALRGDVSFFPCFSFSLVLFFLVGVSFFGFLHCRLYLFFEMAKKKSCQNVRNPRVLSPVERELYGWVDAEVFTQSSVLASEHLPELRREMRLTQDLASERDFILEAAGPSDRLSFRALEDRTHFLWDYVELFTRLGVRRLANFILTLHTPPPGNGFLSFRAYQGRRLFDAFEESIQEFKWHYFKVLSLPGTRPFWVDDEGKPFPWVYWNSGARECRITALDPLETLAFDFLQYLPVGLGKKSNFRCRWILDHSDAEVGAFLDSLLTDMEKQSRFDRLKQKMAEVAEMGPCSVLPHVRTPLTTLGASASGQTVPAPAPVASTAQVPPPATAKKRGSSKDPAGKPFSVEGEEGAKEHKVSPINPAGKPFSVEGEAALGADSSWEHKVSPINRAFPADYNFRATLDDGLTNGPTREILGPLVPEQLLGTAQHLACQLTACLQVGIEKAFAAKVQMEKELVSLKDQVDVLMVERDSALAALLLNAKIKSLTQKLAVSEGERLSALARMAEVEEKAKVQAAQLESCRSALEKEKKEAEGLAKSLREKQTALDGTEPATAHWRDEWKSLAEETGDMVQETFEILMDQSEPMAEERPDPAVGVPLGENFREDAPEVPVVEEGGECPVSNL